MTSDRDYAARVDVLLNQRRWEFGVQDETAEFHDTYEDGRRADLDVPDWIEMLLVGSGVKEVST